MVVDCGAWWDGCFRNRCCLQTVSRIDCPLDIGSVLNGRRYLHVSARRSEHLHLRNEKALNRTPWRQYSTGGIIRPLPLSSPGVTSSSLITRLFSVMNSLCTNYLTIVTSLSSRLPSYLLVIGSSFLNTPGAWGCFTLPLLIMSRLLILTLRFLYLLSNISFESFLLFYLNQLF